MNLKEQTKRQICIFSKFILYTDKERKKKSIPQRPRVNIMLYTKKSHLSILYLITCSTYVCVCVYIYIYIHTQFYTNVLQFLDTATWKCVDSIPWILLKCLLNNKKNHFNILMIFLTTMLAKNNTMIHDTMGNIIHWSSKIKYIFQDARYLPYL